MSNSPTPPVFPSGDRRSHHVGDNRIRHGLRQRSCRVPRHLLPTLRERGVGRGRESRDRAGLLRGSGSAGGLRLSIGELLLGGVHYPVLSVRVYLMSASTEICLAVESKLPLCTGGHAPSRSIIRFCSTIDQPTNQSKNKPASAFTCVPI